MAGSKKSVHLREVSTHGRLKMYGLYVAGSKKSVHLREVSTYGRLKM